MPGGFGGDEARRKAQSRQRRRKPRVAPPRSDAAQRESGERTPRVPTRRSPAFSDPFPSRPGQRALQPQQRAQRAKTRRAARDIPADPTRPRIPVIRDREGNLDYTPRQRQQVIRTIRRDAERKGGLRRYYLEGNLDERRALRLLDELETGRRASAKRRTARTGASTRDVAFRAPPRRSGVSLATSRLLNDLGARVATGHGGALVPYGRVARAVLVETPRAYVEQGGKPLEADARFVLDALAGIVKAPYAVATGQGDELVEGIKQDYSERYGPAVRGDYPAFRRQVGKSGGLSYAVDAAPVASAILKAAGATAKTGAAGAAAERFVTRPRARRRTSFGETVRQRDETQKAAPNVARVALQRGLDRQRTSQVRRRDERAIRRAERAGPEAAVGARRAVRPVENRAVNEDAIRQQGGRVLRDRTGEATAVVLPRARAERAGRSLESAGWTPQVTRGDTVTFFPYREVVTRTRVGERVAQTRSAARVKGRGVSELRRLSGEEYRVFRQATRRLSKPQQAALFYAVTGQVSDVSPEQALAHLTDLENLIRAGRQERGLPEELARTQQDELRTIRYLRDNADEAFGPGLAQAAEKVRAQIDRVEQDSPYLTPERAAVARVGPQAQVLGLERRLAETPKEFRRRRRNLQRDIARAEKRVLRARVPEGAAREAAAIRVSAADRRILARDETYVEAAKAYNEAARELRTARTNFGNAARYRNQGLYTDAELAQATGRVTAAQHTAAEAKADLERVRADVFSRAENQAAARARGEKGSFPLADLGRGPKGTLDRLERRRAALAQRERSLEELRAQAAGLERRRGEPADDFVRRVRETAEATGRPAAAFSPSEPFFDPHFASRAVGGANLPRGPQRRTYELQKTGRQRTDPGILWEGVQRNLKYKITANVIDDTFDRHAHPAYQGLTVKQLRDVIASEGYDLSQVAIWLPDRYRTGLLDMGEQRELLREEGKRVLEDLEPEEAATLNEAVVRSTLTPSTLRELDRMVQAGGNARGALLPRAVFNEVMATTKPEGKIARTFERLKTLQSRTVLGTLNVNWLQADFLANGALASIAGANPITVAKGLAFYRRLPPELRKAWADELDINANRFQTHVPHYGASVNNAWANRYRAWRSTPGWRSARPLKRLIDEFLRAENVVSNQPWRLGVAYKALRSETFARMDRNVGLLNAGIDRVASVFTLGPEQQMRELLKIKDVMEDNGRLVNEALGDFTTLTDIERRTIGRMLFFYPYARFVTRFVFWTLPAKHPVKLSIIGQIGRLTEEEQRELLGVNEDDPEDVKMARALMFGRVFVKDPKVSTGFREFNVKTINPLGNPVSELESSDDILTLTPPWVQWAVGQITKMDVFRWQPWNVRGEKTKPTQRTELGGPARNAEARLGVLLRQLLDLPPITREIQRNALPGEQSSEANLLYGERPLRYKSPERQAQAEARRQRDLDKSFPRQLLEQNFRGFVSRESDIAGQLERRRKGRGIGAPKGTPVPANDPRSRLLRNREQALGSRRGRAQQELLRNRERALAGR